MKNQTIYSFAMAAFVASALFLSSCEEDPIVPAPDQGRILVVHASPNAPAVDLLVDNTKVGTALAYPNNTPYLDVVVGKRNIKVNVTGTSTSAINVDFDVAKNVNYTIFAADSVSKITPVVFTDDLTTPAVGKAHVRVIHMAPNAPKVDVWIDNAKVLSGVRFKEASTFTPLSSGTHTFEVKLENTNTVVISVPNYNLAEKKIYTIFARGFVGGTGTQALGAGVIVNN